MVGCVEPGSEGAGQIPFQRYSSPAPARDGWNLYAYVENKPLNFNDPEGRRQNPATGGTGIDPTSENGTRGRIRSNRGNPRIGLFGRTRNGGTTSHHGIDINAKRGTPLVAAESGTITDIADRGDAGNRIQITTADGTVLTYAHLDSFAPGLSQGDEVQEGTLIGTAGTTGNADEMGADEQHVHLAVTDANGNRVNPVTYLNDPQAPAAANRTLSGENQGDDTCMCTHASVIGREEIFKP